MSGTENVGVPLGVPSFDSEKTCNLFCASSETNANFPALSNSRCLG